MITITHVAIRFRDVIYSLPKPNRHNDVIRHIIDTVPGVTYVTAHGDDQGFLASDGVYYRRKLAFRIAKEAGQLKPGCTGLLLGTLYSEDVW